MIQKPSIAKSQPPVKGAAAFSKSIALLQLVADSQHPVTIADLGRQSGLPRPTLHRLLKALAAEGMVESWPDKTYTVGTRMIRLAGRALEQNDIAKVAGPELTWLCTETQETVHLATHSNRGLVYLMKKDSPRAVRIASSMGGHVPMHASAIGKCVLALLPQKEQDEIVKSMEMTPFTPYTIITREKLQAELELIRHRGYSTAHQETDLEIECFGCAILDRKGRPVAGMSISVPLYRLEAKEKYYEPLMESCRRVSGRLGNQS